MLVGGELPDVGRQTETDIAKAKTRELRTAPRSISFEAMLRPSTRAVHGFAISTCPRSERVIPSQPSKSNEATMRNRRAMASTVSGLCAEHAWPTRG